MQLAVDQDADDGSSRRDGIESEPPAFRRSVGRRSTAAFQSTESIVVSAWNAIPLSERANSSDADASAMTAVKGQHAQLVDDACADLADFQQQLGVPLRVDATRVQPARRARDIQTTSERRMSVTASPIVKRRNNLIGYGESMSRHEHAIRTLQKEYARSSVAAVMSPTPLTEPTTRTTASFVTHMALFAEHRRGNHVDWARSSVSSSSESGYGQLISPRVW